MLKIRKTRVIFNCKPAKTTNLSLNRYKILTFRFFFAGSDWQSRSMCSPTLISGVSPLGTGTGLQQSGQTGTCTSFLYADAQ